MTDQFTGKVLAEKYRVDSYIHGDAVAGWYHGTHLLMEKRVCLKILPAALAADEAIKKRFSDEARTFSRISHPNFLNVTDYGSDPSGDVFIVFEDASGETLRDTLNRIVRLPFGLAARIIKQTAAAVSIGHENNVPHFNLSPDCILVRSGMGNKEEVKVFDFGSKFDINDLDFPAKKARYLSPEQCAVSGKPDTRSDIYSLGVIMFELLAGSPPFDAEGSTDLLLKHMNEPPPPLSNFRRDLPDDVDDFILRSLAKNPEIRFQSIAEFTAELDRLAAMIPDSGRETFGLIPAAVTDIPAGFQTAAPPQKADNNLWKTAFIVLAGVTLLGGGFIYLTSSKTTNPSTNMQSDANGIPVQPVSPATGATEQNLSNMDSFNQQLYGNTNSAMPESGGVYNPYWDNGTRPPGAPPPGSTYGDPFPVQPGSTGPQVYMDSNGSIFMPNEDGTYREMVPKKTSNSATNANAAPPTKNSNSNVSVPANVAPKTTPSPAGPGDAKPTPTPAPKATPAPKPKSTPAPPPNTTSQTGKNTDAK